MTRVHVRVTLRPSILDPEGQAVGHALARLGLGAVAAVRAGKHFELDVETDDPAEAERVAREAASRLLANPVTEDFEVTAVEPQGRRSQPAAPAAG